VLEFLPYKDRRRVGVLVIPDEIVAPEEIATMLEGHNLQYCQQRVDFVEVDTPANRAAALTAMEAGVRLIGRVRPQAVVFACTSGGVFAGPEFHEEKLRRMRSALPGIEVCTAADAVARALNERGVRRIVVGTPYSDDTMAALAETLDTRGIEVLSTAKLFPEGYPDPWTVMSTDPATVAGFARRIDDPRADAVFISCTGLPSTPVLAQVEAALGKPFLTSNVAVARVLQRALQLGPIDGFGSILQESPVRSGT
jgi:maleate isomerase